MPFTGDCHMVSCAREGHVRLAELSSTGTCKTTRKLAQHHGAAHKVEVFHTFDFANVTRVHGCSVGVSLGLSNPSFLQATCPSCYQSAVPK